METASSTPASGNGRRIHGVALISVLTALMLTLLLEALDQTIVGTALPKIVGYLHGFDRYTWVVTAYLLASTTMVPIVGKLSDQFGRKWFFVAGVIVFLTGSVLSGASQSMSQLIAFRALQGLGAGTGIALVFTVVGDIFPPAERARWQGIFGAVYGFSSVVGPTAGGWLTDHGPLLGHFVTNATRWRWVFYVNLPIGLVALAALLIYLPRNISVRSTRFQGMAAIKRIDFLGAALASVATICLLLGLTWGSDQTYTWGSAHVVGTLVAAAVLYIAFFFVERRAVEPILPLDLFRNQVFTSAAVLSLMTGAVLLSLAIYLPLFLQGVLRESATNSGVVITPLTVSLTIGATFSAIAIARAGRYQRYTIFGGGVLTIGVFLMTLWTSKTSLLTASIEMIIAGFGLGIFFAVLTLAVQNALPRTRLGVGTGAVTYLRSLGQTLGVAIVGTVVNNTIASDITHRLPAAATRFIPAPALKAITNPQVLISPDYHNQVVQQAHASAPPAFQGNVDTVLGQIFNALRQSLAVAIQHGFVVVLCFAVIVLVTTFFLKDVPLAKEFRDDPTEHSGAATSEPVSETAGL